MGGSDTETHFIVDGVPSAYQVVKDFHDSLSLDTDATFPFFQFNFEKMTIDENGGYKFSDQFAKNNAYSFNCYYQCSSIEIKARLKNWYQFGPAAIKSCPLLSQDKSSVITKIQVEKIGNNYHVQTAAITMTEFAKKIFACASSADHKLNQVMPYLRTWYSKFGHFIQTDRKNICRFVHRWPSTLMTFSDYKRFVDPANESVMSDSFEIVEDDPITLYVEKFSWQHYHKDFNSKKFLIDKMTKLAMVSFFADSDEIIPMGAISWAKLVPDEIGEECKIVDSNADEHSSFINILPPDYENMTKRITYHHWTLKTLYSSCVNACSGSDKFVGEVQLFYNGYPFTARIDQETKKIQWKFSNQHLTQYNPSFWSKRLKEIITESGKDVQKLDESISKEIEQQNHSFMLLNQPIVLFQDKSNGSILTEDEFAKQNKLLHIRFQKGTYRPEPVCVNQPKSKLFKIYSFSTNEPLHVQTLSELINDLKKYPKETKTDFAPAFSLGHVSFNYDEESQNVQYKLNWAKLPCEPDYRFPTEPFNFISIKNLSDTGVYSSCTDINVGQMIEYLSPIAEKYPHLWVLIDVNIFELSMNDSGSLSFIKSCQYFRDSKLFTLNQMITEFDQLTNLTIPQIEYYVNQHTKGLSIEKLTLVKLAESKKVMSIRSIKDIGKKFLDNYLYYDCHKFGSTTVYIGKEFKKLADDVFIPVSIDASQPNFCFTVGTLKRFLSTYCTHDYVMLDPDTKCQTSMTFYGEPDPRYGRNVITFSEGKLTQLKSVDEILKCLPSDDSDPVVCDGKHST